MVQPRNTSSSSSTQNKTNKDLLQNSLHQIIFIRSGLEYENLNGLNYRHRFGLAQTAATGKRQTLFQTNDFGYVLLNRHLFIWIQPYLYNILCVTYIMLHNICTSTLPHGSCLFVEGKLLNQACPYDRRKSFMPLKQLWSRETDSRLTHIPYQKGTPPYQDKGNDLIRFSYLECMNPKPIDSQAFLTHQRFCQMSQFEWW